mgnify:CR=1 FL=1
MKAEIDYRGEIHVVIPVKPIVVEVEIKTNDIYNWLLKCDSPEALHYISEAALRRARCIEHPEFYEDDDFRSRA